MKPKVYELRSKFELGSLPKIADFIEKNITRLGCKDRQVIHDVLLAVDEASSNLIKHSKAKLKKDYFVIQLHCPTPTCIQTKIIDFTEPFSFEAHPILTPSLSVEEQLKHGWGIGLLKTITENATYCTFKTKNILTFFKYFNPQGDPHEHSRTKSK
ncbi:MAG: ATP-binding protein [Deltaproteobacteria bacterium]|nr:ATP-binding protein [Deltaproteobacteria bacterium]